MRTSMAACSGALLAALSLGGTCADEIQEAVAGSNRFGLDLHRALLREGAGGNVFISPLSVSTALRMVLHGAGGETLSQMQRTLGVDGIGTDALARADLALLETLRSADPRVELAIANSVWARQGIPFQQTFLDLVRRDYGARVEAIDFSSPAAPGTINAWVRENTRGKIDSIVPDPLPRGAILYLINAVYFKGTWARRFDRGLTREAPFTLADGRRTGHPMMSQRGEFGYLRGDRFQAVRLPYGGRRAEMVVFLPDEGAEDLFHAGLTAETWARWMGAFGEREGTVGLPRFEIEYEKSLVDTLKGIGMEVAFGEGADFSGICSCIEGPVYISDVRHKAYVKVDEEGTEAAAVTSVMAFAESEEPEEPPFRLICDRPFFFAIVDTRTGAILFTGSILDPRGSG